MSKITWERFPAHPKDADAPTEQDGIYPDWCGELGQDGRGIVWMCTREKDHAGQHIARNHGTAYLAWTDEGTKDE